MYIYQVLVSERVLINSTSFLFPYLEKMAKWNEEFHTEFQSIQNSKGPQRKRNKQNKKTFKDGRNGSSGRVPALQA
jgi:hypothetical protein